MTSTELAAVTGTLPAGVLLRWLDTHDDERGALTEVFRESWGAGVEPVQWNLVRSQAGVLRGVHVHPRHDDYLVVVQGRASIGLRDLRRGSPTHGAAALVEMRGDRLAALTTPHGVAHGFYFHEPSIQVYCVSDYWDLEDELGCRWDDPALEIPWPAKSASVSSRDAEAPSLSELLDRLEPWQPF